MSMVKFCVSFKAAADASQFENAYQDFLALAERMPDVKRRQVVHVLGSPQGEPLYYRVLELYFSDIDTLQQALLSPQGQEAGRELARFPAGSVDLSFGDVYEE
jgi:uncharacterized protein (TIGR02118 family)